MSLTLDAIRNCLDGLIPASIATCTPEGEPNIAYLSQVHYVDPQHVALSFQFFNKTRANVLVNPHATVQVIDPDTAAHYLLSLRYLRTETAGAIFENMKAKLAGIASHTGMSKVFRLLGADIYEVLQIEAVPCPVLALETPPRSILSALKQSLQSLTRQSDLSTLLDQTLLCLSQHFDIQHALLLMLDETGQRLYTVASQGYSVTGVGSEIALGQGVIGIAAQERTPIRIIHMAQDSVYSRAVQLSMQKSNPCWNLETKIPFPGLAEPSSQLAVPIVFDDRLLGVLYVESEQELRFTYEDEDALLILAQQLAAYLHITLQKKRLIEPATTSIPLAAHANEQPVPIRYYPADSSVFIDNEYLIKGVAGAILWKLLRDFDASKRTNFSNRELRMDPSIRLPDLSDNLESRLILLQRRLAERCSFLRIEKSGRGRFCLSVDRPICLQTSPDITAT